MSLFNNNNIPYSYVLIWLWYICFVTFPLFLVYYCARPPLILFAKYLPLQNKYSASVIWHLAIWLSDFQDTLNLIVGKKNLLCARIFGISLNSISPPISCKKLFICLFVIGSRTEVIKQWVSYFVLYVEVIPVKADSFNIFNPLFSNTI